MHNLSAERIRAVSRALLLYLFFALLALTTLVFISVIGIVAEAVAESEGRACGGAGHTSSQDAAGTKGWASNVFGAVLSALPQAEDGIAYAAKPAQRPVVRSGWSRDHLVLVVNYEPDSARACERHVFVSTGKEARELLGKWVTGQSGDRLSLTSFEEAKPLSRIYGKELKGCGDLIIYGLSSASVSQAPGKREQPILSALAALLREDPGLKVRAVGHRASSGDPEKDYALSLNDAEAVKGALVEKFGIGPERIFAEGAGAEEPMAENDTVTGRAANSRMEIIAERSCQRTKESIVAAVPGAK